MYIVKEVRNMTLKERLDKMNGPLQTNGLAKTKKFVQSPVVTKALAAKVEKEIAGATFA